ncbi:DMT family transporter [Phaeobacter sp. QD34_3]|uniref:DMT family transporter n=1 Tax=unclassified Phaeobacter TaxID=2621772 RepID=UPI00237F913F|nr:MULTISPECIES: DMT family transporter [unclassified Phaeobacter]MDE4131838.1 DMT family transporter [Phaeobacter sp. QD34_3]MDE4135476.1 DMT family transporter [Phaeobacter sp. QD34_24]MDE4173465.1 DMT family transporter [Phaeobacter sp. PT47_59]
MTEDRPLLGIVLMLGFCVLAPLGDAVAKLLGGHMPLGMLIFVRFAAQVILLVPLVWGGQRLWRMKGRVLRLTFLRTLLHIGGIGAMFTALKHLPLADAVAIAFVMPFIMLLIGKFILDEEVGARRIIACIVGFGGTLLVIQPSFAAVGLHALWPLAVAVIFAFFMMVTRQIAKETDPIGLQAVSGAMACALLAPLLLIGDAFDIEGLEIVAPDLWISFLMASIGVLGTGAHLLMTWSLRYAPAATLAPMQYLEIPVATLFGWLIFSEFPNSMAAAGIVITVAAGLYVILREQAVARRAAKDAMPQSPA